MITDALLLLSGSMSAQNVITGQTVTGTGNILSTNTIDLSQARDIGEGEVLYLRSQVTVAQLGCTSVEIQVIAADDAALTANVAVIGSTGAIPLASLVINARFSCVINPRIANVGQRYLGCRYVIVGTSTAGAFVTDIGPGIQDGQAFYPSGFTVI